MVNTFLQPNIQLSEKLYGPPQNAAMAHRLKTTVLISEKLESNTSIFTIHNFLTLSTVYGLTHCHIWMFGVESFHQCHEIGCNLLDISSVCAGIRHVAETKKLSY